MIGLFQLSWHHLGSGKVLCPHARDVAGRGFAPRFQFLGVNPEKPNNSYRARCRKPSRKPYAAQSRTSCNAHRVPGRYLFFGDISR
ncbi:hypothetical protein BST61_g11178 [Cercospora zeina]